MFPLLQQSEEDEQEEILGDEEPAFEHQTFPVEYNSINNMVEVNDTPISKQYLNFEDEQSKTPKRQWTEIEDEYDAIGEHIFLMQTSKLIVF